MQTCLEAALNPPAIKALLLWILVLPLTLIWRIFSFGTHIQEKVENPRLKKIASTPSTVRCAFHFLPNSKFIMILMIVTELWNSWKKALRYTAKKKPQKISLLVKSLMILKPQITQPSSFVSNEITGDAIQNSRCCFQEKVRFHSICKNISIPHESMLGRLNLVQLFCDPVDCSLPCSPIHGILQARILEWAAMPSSEGSSQPRDPTHVPSVSYISKWVLCC